MKIADKPGVYKDFSGDIKWGNTDCNVRNADFEILEQEDDRRKDIVFDDAVFVSGAVWWCAIKNALNLGCNFRYCDMEYMINKRGTVYSCDWRDGIFEGGVFRYGTWYDGIWISGEWKEGRNSSGKLMKSTPDKWKK